MERFAPWKTLWHTALRLLAAVIFFAAAPAAGHAGTIVSASCPCGFHKDNLFLFGGKASFRTQCRFPALCRATGDLVLVNVLDRTGPAPDCPGSPPLSYADPALHGGGADKAAASWNIPDGGGLVLYEAGYLCPRCLKFTLGFRVVGHWD